MPYRGYVIHARWSGEALWSPLAAVWPPGAFLLPENATGNPQPGDILLFAGQKSEPELLIAYGACRFASRAGPLQGNPVLTIDDRLAQLVEQGHKILWRGAMDLGFQ